MAAAAFMPRPNSGSCPTSTKFFDVPGVPPPGPAVTPSGCAAIPPGALTALAAGAASRPAEATRETSTGRNLIIVTSPGEGADLAAHTVDPSGPPDKRQVRSGPTVIMYSERSLVALAHVTICA